MKVIEEKEVSEDCSTCLYASVFGCSHADRQKDWMYYMANPWHKCPSWWLDHRRFTKAPLNNLGVYQ